MIRIYHEVFNCENKFNLGKFSKMTILVLT